MKAFTEATRPAARAATPRHYLMCPPTEFDVVYSINPWMDPSKPVDAQLAFRQWQRIHDVFVELGHQVDTVEPVRGLPDMVFAANGAVVRDGRALVARFMYEERAAEAQAYLDWFAAHGFETRQAAWTSEGQGDILQVGGWLLAGSGFRTDRRSHTETEEYFGCPVVGLTLVDESYNHLDTALAVIGEQNIMYYPRAFSPGSQALLRELFPDAILATHEDAASFGLNAVCDGSHVLLPAGAARLTAQLRDRGYETIDIEVGELLLAGGGVKSCALELCGAKAAAGQPTAAPATTDRGRSAVTASRPLPAVPSQGDPARSATGLTVVVTSVASDSHTWNLVYLQLVLEELGHRVVNLGACVPDDLLVSECLRIRPDLVVVSTVNGHGFHDGMRMIGRIRACQELAATPVVIGGKLGIAGPAGRASRDQLRAAGFDAVFEEGGGIAALTSLAGQLRASAET
jgi:N-dimethylarginine dimethylaminohydrolase/methylmalonyl-CoA mutase cobalamin-binding subunit